jgi:hypothetical protein
MCESMLKASLHLEEGLLGLKYHDLVQNIFRILTP